MTLIQEKMKVSILDTNTQSQEWDIVLMHYENGILKMAIIMDIRR